MAKRKGARWGHPLLLPMRGYRGCGHPVATAARMVRILHFGKLFITFITSFCIEYCLAYSFHPFLPTTSRVF